MGVMPMGTDTRLAIYDDLREQYLPTVCDYIATLYARVLPVDDKERILLVSVHQAMWSHGFALDFLSASKCRKTLIRLALAKGFSQEHIDRIDALVLDELMEIVAMRYRRSPSAVVAYNRAVLAVVTETVGFETLKAA
jgi:hypothetical protein